MGSNRTLLLPLFFLLAIVTVSRSDDVNCVYSMYIRTGSIFKAGTNSAISVMLYDKYNNSVNITDLVSWGGAMEPGHDYFEWRNLDIFTGTAPCLKSPPCAMNISSDGSRDHHGWNCDYVEVTITGVHAGCLQRYFKVDQWLALDVSPYRLWAFIDKCGSSDTVEGKHTFVPREVPPSVFAE